MCDEDTVEDDKKYLRKPGNLSRREFNMLTTGAALALLLPRSANAMDVIESDVTVKTPDGMADCLFVHPAKGKHPGVIIWPDVLGLRPAFRLMGKRLAESGYSVLVVNPYYRSAKSPVISEGASFGDEATRNIVLPMARQLSATTHMTDARAFVSFLDQQKPVDTNRKIGTTGYCMGGPITMRTAAAVPDRIGAGASFHGGRLVTDNEDSPHLQVPTMKAQFLFAIAANDDERDPESKNVLRKAYASAGLAAEIEVYDGAMHGWCPPDSRVYNKKQAERAWARLLVLFETALA
ncbi:MAG: dienelactone hydrolase family protein [bacterium]|nr:dienelactone hydrolase family protein [Gammaproteobacteria bacterium]HIL98131.1 dienelactone hydrolase family protein [Pseudomonadales bacterium]